MNKEKLYKHYEGELRTVVQFAAPFACEGLAVEQLRKFGKDLEQLLRQTYCYKLRELLVQKLKYVEEIIKGIDKEDKSLIDTWHNYQQGLKYALSLIDTVSP